MPNRDSTKHGPRVDDALKEETSSLQQGAPIESRVEEYRELEGPGEGDRHVDAHTAPPGALGADSVEARRELSRHLRLSAFPATRAGLLDEARSQNAPAPVLDALALLPEVTVFRTVHEVWIAVSDPSVAPDELGETASHDPLSSPDR